MQSTFKPMLETAQTGGAAATAWLWVGFVLAKVFKWCSAVGVSGDGAMPYVCTLCDAVSL